MGARDRTTQGMAMAIGARPAPEHRWLAGGGADPTLPSGPWIKQPQEVCTTKADTITDQLPGAIGPRRAGKALPSDRQGLPHNVRAQRPPAGLRS